MNRVQDYVQFSVRFAGLGYIALWPLTVHEGAIAELEASLICGERFLTEAICRLPQPLTLTPGLHLIGLTSALAVVALCVWRRLIRLRPARRAPPPVQSAPAAQRSRMPAGLTERPRPVKPRRQFGLRGLPH